MTLYHFYAKQMETIIFQLIHIIINGFYVLVLSTLFFSTFFLISIFMIDKSKKKISIPICYGVNDLFLTYEIL